MTWLDILPRIGSVALIALTVALCAWAWLENRLASKQAKAARDATFQRIVRLLAIMRAASRQVR